jgi:hypothetical protein
MTTVISLSPAEPRRMHSPVGLECLRFNLTPNLVATDHVGHHVAHLMPLGFLYLNRPMRTS